MGPHLLKNNLIANSLGQGWVALMGLAFIPLYIKYLGIEAYGLIGLFSLLQVWLSLLDMGMTPTLGREMSRFTAGSHTAESIRDLLRSIEIIALVISVLIGAGIALSANWIAGSWLQVEALPVEVVAQAFIVMGLVTAIRFMEGVYRSSIVGLQRQVLFNLVNSAMATLRGLGSVGVLAWISASIEAFFIWQGLVSIASLIALATTTYLNLPRAQRTGRFSWKGLRGVWRFAAGMTGINFLVLLLMQVDKVLLSKLLSLIDYGYYTLASVAAAAIYMLITPITQAFYPRFCELLARNDQSSLIKSYHNGSQLATILTGSAAIVLGIFSETFLRLWTQNTDLADRAAPLLSILILGNFLNSLMWIPYQSQLAHGWTSLTIRINVVAVAIIVPTIFWITPLYGAEGAAWVWVGLNAGYVLIGIQFMHRRILVKQKWSWYLQDVIIPMITGLIIAIPLSLFTPLGSSTLNDIVLLTFISLITMCAMILGSNRIRPLIISYINKLRLIKSN
jgi:O-antigen/teichoic acid export membrane protein